jgi:hypothetical protein
MTFCFFLLALGQTPERSGNSIGRGIQAFADGMRASRQRPSEASGFFREALDDYEAGRKEAGEAPWLLRQIGHSYLLTDNLPHAIAAYRRGLAIDPADAKLRTALDYARDQVPYPPAGELRPRPDLWPAWLSLRYVGVYAFALYFAGCLAATRWLMTRRRRWLVAAGLLLAIAAVPAVGSAIAWQREQRDAAQPVVVVNRDAPLRTGNGADYPAKLDVPLPRGCEVRRLFERGGWLQVETAGGAIGWLPQNAVVTADLP